MKFTIYDKNNKPYLRDIDKDIEDIEKEYNMEKGKMRHIIVQVVDGNENIYIKFENINHYNIILDTDFDFAYILKNPEPKTLIRLLRNTKPVIHCTYLVTKNRIKEWEKIGENSKSNHVACDRMIKFLGRDNESHKEYLEYLETRLEDEIRELTKEEQEELEQARKNKEIKTVQIRRNEK